MDYIIFNRINNYFEEREFQSIPTDSKTVKMFATYQKSSLYLINVIALNSNYSFDKSKFEKYKEITKKQFDHVNVDKIVLLNLILIEEVERVHDEVNYCPEIEETFIDINWIIDTINNKLIIPKNQINNVMGLEKSIVKVIGLQEEDIQVKLNRQNKFPIITSALIGINIIVWLLIECFGSSFDSNTLINFGALYTPLIIANKQYWRLFTSMFIHIGATHLAFNCFSLYFWRKT